MTNKLDPTLPSIIIPAYNEAACIQACLRPLLTLNGKRYNIVVSCNGCTDATAELARAVSNQIYVIETNTASKIVALNNAEKLPLGFPRIYMDADVLMSSTSIEALLAAAVQHPEDTLIVPKSTMDLAQSSPWVKRFYREWYRTDFINKAGFGCGVYMLGQQARAKFDEWPELVADDNFIRQFFPLDNIYICQAAVSLVKAPASISQLIDIKARSKYGNIELDQSSLSVTNEQTSPSISYRPRLTIDSAIYCLVNAVAAFRSRRMYNNRSFTWLRDTSHR